MARPKADAPVDLTTPHNLTVGLIDRLTCPEGQPKAFLRDREVAGLRVRVTANGAKAFVYEAKLNGKAISRTIGAVALLSISEARQQALDLARLVKGGTDPRELDRQREAAQAAAEAQAEADRAVAAVQALTVGEAWTRYLAERKPRWGDRTYLDHLKIAAPGGIKRQRAEGFTTPGPLAHFMAMRLADLTPAAVEAWAVREAADRPARVRLALRLLKAFMNWAAAEPDLKGLADPTAASAKKAREAAGKAGVRDDVLLREQLPAWFKHVRAIGNPVIAAYAQVLLLTGARPGEVLELRWDDINVQWRGMTIRDKVEGERQIPLTPYVWHLLSALPRRNEWVFSSTRTVSMDPKHAARRTRRHAAQGTDAPVGAVAQSSASGHLTSPDDAHRCACAAAGLAGLTLHGLRRSFASLTEWLETPAGVVAQIQGHKPSATAEKHYKRRPLDLLRVHHERIEAWVLAQAGIEFVPPVDATQPAGLRLAASN